MFIETPFQSYSEAIQKGWTMTDDGFWIPPENEYTFNIGSSMHEDKIDLNLDSLSTNGFWKYEEDLTLKEIRDYPFTLLLQVNILFILLIFL